MSVKTGIEWTDATWNPVTGCTKVSAGCKNCYAERDFHRPYPGRAFTDVHLHPDRLEQPLHWKKPRKIFVNSMGDLFHEKVPNEFIAKVFNVMSSATLECAKRHAHVKECWTGEPHTFQLLTKRPERLRQVISNWLPSEVGQFWPGDSSLAMAMGEAWPLPNVWLGVSVEDQKTADERIPLLLQTQAAVHFVSYEPALGPVDLTPWSRRSWLRPSMFRNLRPHLPPSRARTWFPTSECSVGMIQPAMKAARPAVPRRFLMLDDSGVKAYLRKMGEGMGGTIDQPNTTAIPGMRIWWVREASLRRNG